MSTKRIKSVFVIAMILGPASAASWITAASAGAAGRGSDSSQGRDSLGFGDSLLVQLAVADLERAISFYKDVLGFELFHRNDGLSWAKLRSPVDKVVIGVGVSPEPEGSGSLSLNFTVTDIEHTRNRLERRGVTFAGPTVTIPGVVKLAELTDPDGNRIRLAQGLAPAGE